MGMFGKIGEWYDVHAHGGQAGAASVIDIIPTVNTLAYAEDVLYGNKGRAAKIGAVTSPVAKMAILSAHNTMEP